MNKELIKISKLDPTVWEDCIICEKESIYEIENLNIGGIYFSCKDDLQKVIDEELILIEEN